MTTKILGEATGIQWQGVQDHTQGQPSSNGVPLLIGSFKRGRIDKPMIIHNGNIQSELGYEPHNPDYVAVQAMLDTGVPSVNVLRVSNITTDILDEYDFVYPVMVGENNEIPKNSMLMGMGTNITLLVRKKDGSEYTITSPNVFGETLQDLGFVCQIEGIKPYKNIIEFNNIIRRFPLNAPFPEMMLDNLKSGEFTIKTGCSSYTKYNYCLGKLSFTQMPDDVSEVVLVPHKSPFDKAFSLYLNCLMVHQSIEYKVDGTRLINQTDNKKMYFKNGYRDAYQGEKSRFCQVADVSNLANAPQSISVIDYIDEEGYSQIIINESDGLELKMLKLVGINQLNLTTHQTISISPVEPFEDLAAKDTIPSNIPPVPNTPIFSNEFGTKMFDGAIGIQSSNLSNSDNIADAYYLQDAKKLYVRPNGFDQILVALSVNTINIEISVESIPT